MKNTKITGGHTLDDYIKSNNWKNFDNALISFGKRLDPKEVFSFHLCPPNSKQKSILNEKATKVQLCANLIDSQEEYFELFNYYNTKLYDQVRSSGKPQNCERRVCTEIRSLTLSRICKDKKCLDEKVRKNFMQSCPECKDESAFLYDSIFSKCYQDATPITGFKFN